MPAMSATTAIKAAAVMPASVESTAMMMPAGTGIVMMAVMGLLRLAGVGIVAAQKPEAATRSFGTTR